MKETSKQGMNRSVWATVCTQYLFEPFERRKNQCAIIKNEKGILEYFSAVKLVIYASIFRLFALGLFVDVFLDASLAAGLFRLMRTASFGTKGPADP